MSDDESYSVCVGSVEYEKLMENGRQLETQKRANRQLKDNFDNQKRLLERQIAGLQKQVKQRDSDIQKFSVDSLKLRNERMLMQDKLEDLEDEIQAQAEKTKKEMQVLQAKAKELSSQLVDEQRQCKMFSGRCVELTNQLRAAEEELTKRKPSSKQLSDSGVSTDPQILLSSVGLQHIQSSPEHKKVMHSQEPYAGSKVIRRSGNKEAEANIQALNERIGYLDMSLKSMSLKLNQKNRELEELVEKLANVQKEHNDEKLLNQNLYEQLKFGDQEFNEIVSRLQKDIKDRDDQLEEKTRMLNELKDRANTKAENLAGQLKQAEKLLKDNETENNKLREVEQQLRAKITELSLKLNEAQKQLHPSKDHTNILEKISIMLKGACGSKHVDELKEEIQHKLNLQAEYERIITETETRLRECKQENETLKRQLDGSQRFLNEIMDVNSRKDAELAVHKADIQRLQKQARETKAASVETENRYQIALSDLREELRKSERAQDELKTIVKLMESKDDFIEYYVNGMQTRLKDESPRVITRLIHDDLDDFIKKLAKRIPGKML